MTDDEQKTISVSVILGIVLGVLALILGMFVRDCL